MTATASGYRRAIRSDYAQILRLQSDNHIANLSEAEREQGFLSAQFTPEQTAQIAALNGYAIQLAAMVALVDDQVAGFLCAFRKEFPTGSPVIAKMLEAYDRLNFEDRPLSAFNSYIYGPLASAADIAGVVYCAGFMKRKKRIWPDNSRSGSRSFRAAIRIH